MDVLITGCDTDLGRTIAEGFCEAGHTVLLSGSRRDDLEVLAKELDVDALVFDNTDPTAMADLHGQIPAHLDTVINVPAPKRTVGDPRTYTLSDHAADWHGAFESVLVSAVLTIALLGDNLRAGGSIVTVVPELAHDGSAVAAVKAAVADWTAGQSDHFGSRGITINAVAVGRGIEPGYDGLGSTPPAVGAELTRLSLFLMTPAARHITGQTLHVSHGALANFA